MTIPLASELAKIARTDLADRPAVGARLMMLAANIARLERAMDEIVADAMDDARVADNEAKVLKFKRMK